MTRRASPLKICCPRQISGSARKLKTSLRALYTLRSEFWFPRSIAAGIISKAYMTPAERQCERPSAGGVKHAKRKAEGQQNQFIELSPDAPLWYIPISSKSVLNCEVNMRRAHQVIRSHSHFFVITTLLIIVMTFPTIAYVFQTDEFRLPTGNSTDVFIHIWDIWYGKQILSGQADRFYTDLLFYPEGVSLVHHPIYGFPLNIALQSALQSLMPVSNAFSLTYLLVVFANASAAYIYALWLFEDRWIALFGALVFGLQPHSLTLPNFLPGSTVMTIPLTFYCLHRGIRERNYLRIVLAGLLTGLTATISLYTFACLVLTLAAGVCAFAVCRWRDRRFWLNIGLLAIIAAVSSFSAVYPVLADSQSLDAAIAWHGSERSVDVLAAIVNRDNPFIGAFLVSIFNTLAEAEIVGTGYLGYLPLVLIGIGLLSKTVRRKMLPWLILFLGFYTLTLGSTLSVNGVNLPEILLPKHFLNEIVPVFFKAFSETRIFQIGVLLPLSVLACYGLAGLREARPIAGRSWFILLLTRPAWLLEYYIPTRERVIIDDQIAYNDWLADEDTRNSIDQPADGAQ